MGFAKSIRSIFGGQKKRSASSAGVAFLISGAGEELEVSGYIPLSRSPEVVTACRTVASLISSMTIHLMANTKDGDQRIVNALSRTIDINPSPYMTRRVWMESIVMNLLLYGRGNSVVWPHTKGGRLQSLEPISANRVNFIKDIKSNDGGYLINLDGKAKKPDQLLHFVYNPNQSEPWRGDGVQVLLSEVVRNLAQASNTERGFLGSKWKPSLIVKVDALTEEFASTEGRRRLANEYLQTGAEGEPWIVPAEMISIEQVKPLSLKDLAISEVVELDRKLVASIVGVPAFLLGVGTYNKEEWNAFIQHTVMPIAKGIEQELTRKLIVSDKMYLKFNIQSLLDWNVTEIASVFGGLSDRGIVDGNEVRDKLGMSPREGLSELRLLENYIPADRIGDQKKLKSADDTETVE